jgi:hypothetical protein
VAPRSTGFTLGLIGLGFLSLATVVVAVITLVPGESDTQEAQEEGAVAGQGAMEDYLNSLIEPLRQAAIDHNEDPGQYIPPDAEIQLALASGSMDSPESERVMQSLRAGYEHYLMRFPGAPGGLDSPEGTVSSDRVPATDPAAALRPWFQLRIQALQEAAQARNQSVDDWIPSPGSIEAAASSGSLQSAESEGVIARLREGYLAMELEFPEPLVP